MDTELEQRRQLAEAVRQACLQAALQGYQEAGWSGLCAEGRWELALDRIRTLDLDALLRQHAAQP